MRHEREMPRRRSHPFPDKTEEAKWNRSSPSSASSVSNGFRDAKGRKGFLFVPIFFGFWVGQQSAHVHTDWRTTGQFWFYPVYTPWFRSLVKDFEEPPFLKEPQLGKGGQVFSFMAFLFVRCAGWLCRKGQQSTFMLACFGSLLLRLAALQKNRIRLLSTVCALLNRFSKARD